MEARLGNGTIFARLKPWEERERTQKQIVDELRTQAALAIEHGFDGVMTSEHHGGFAGYLASTARETVTFADLRRAVVFGSVLASYNVEQFSLERMRSLTDADIAARYESFKLFSHFEVIED